MSRQIEYEVLCSFLDMPVGDAVKILKISTHTMLRIRKQHGLSKWPFDAIKHETFRMDWTDVACIRAAQLKRCDLDEDTRGYLEAAQRRGWLMRKLYARKEVHLATERAISAQDCPAPASDASVACAKDNWTDLAVEEQQEEQGILEGDFFLEPSHPDNHQHIEWAYREEDEEEWGILGHGL